MREAHRLEQRTVHGQHGPVRNGERKTHLAVECQRIGERLLRGHEYTVAD